MLNPGGAKPATGDAGARMARDRARRERESMREGDPGPAEPAPLSHHRIACYITSMERRTLTLRVHALLTLAALVVGGWAQASGLHGCASHGAGERGAYHAGPAAHDAGAAAHDAAAVAHHAVTDAHHTGPGLHDPGSAAYGAAVAGHEAAPVAHDIAASHARSDADPSTNGENPAHRVYAGHAAPAHHGAHHAPAGGHHGECTCLGDCQAGAGISLPTYVAATAPVATESTLTTAVEGDDAAPLRRAAYLIPFATAPPSLA